MTQARTLTLIAMAALAMTACSGQPANDAVAEDEAVRRTPNIVIVYMDDLGYGDLPVYNAASLIDTPRLSAFAAEAMVFTDAHSPSAVCTPSRYGLLTGRYAWRSWLKAGVVGGYSPSVIREGEITLARLLQDQGYDTAAIGKWHLGWGDAEPDMALFMQGFSTERVDFTTPPSIRPTTLGFDYFYGLSASLDFPPYAWIENGVYVQAPTESVEVRGEGLYQDGGFYWRAGESAPDFDFKDVEPQIMNRAAAYIRGRADTPGTPFFLYVASTAPHTPVLPTEAFQGQSAAGAYGDFVSQNDANFGLVLDAIEEAGLSDNTVVIFTSDNGAVNYANLVATGHAPNGDLRGQKSELYEGGHRVPFVVRTPDQRAGRSDQLVVQTDVFATLSELIGVDVPAGEAVDSISFAPVLSGASASARDEAVHHGLFGTFALRSGPWKLIADDQGGGYGAQYASLAQRRMPDPAPSTYRLFNLESDPGETTDVAADYPEVATRLAERLETIRSSQRTAP